MTTMIGIPDDVMVEREELGIAVVRCRRCGASIGRLETRPTEPDADQEQIYAEVRLIASEHRPTCGLT
jgi:hypothetical protein